MGWKVSPIYKQYLEEQKKTHTEEDYKNGWYWKNGKLIFRAIFPRRSNGKHTKSPSLKTIHTISYYGSKRSWRTEFREILIHAHNLRCKRLIDVFGGSGIISLLASDLGIFDYIQLNDIYYEIVNYHNVIKDEKAFKRFLYFIDKLSRCKEELYIDKIKNYQKSIQGKEEREQFRKIGRTGAEKAALFYCVKHHEYSGQGGIIANRKLIADYIPALKRTHQLYKNINITQYHFKKVLLDNVNSIDTLLFLDCPYLPQTRKQKKSYKYEMSHLQHVRMLEILTDGVLGAKVIVCGYDNRLYNNYFLRCNDLNNTSWHCVKLKISGVLKKGAEAKERIWCNFGIITLVEKNPNLFELIY